jgi:small-conductance mechanosensitive channel
LGGADSKTGSSVDPHGIRHRCFSLPAWIANSAFKGISVFVGVLLSLGSTSAVAHGVAGTILTYMRAFQVGDFVRIGDNVGEVIKRTLLVTRVCTQKNEVVTIPNGTVLGRVVVNYSAEARKRGVIFHTVATIGYGAPWRQVQELLISAAARSVAIRSANCAERFLCLLRTQCLYRKVAKHAEYLFDIAPEHPRQIQRSRSGDKFAPLHFVARRERDDDSAELFS